jgi:hypothetical protein
MGDADTNGRITSKYIILLVTVRPIADLLRVQDGKCCKEVVLGVLIF